MGTYRIHMDTAQITQQVARSVSQAIVTSGLSKKAVAEATGIPLTTLGRKLLGTSDFTVVELALIADALGVRRGALLPSDLVARRPDRRPA